MIGSLEELRHLVVGEETRRVAVADASGEPTLRAVCAADDAGLARSILVGEAGVIRARLVEIGEEPDRFEILDRPTPEDSARVAVRLVRSGAADVLMKGALQTSTLLHAVLDRDAGLRSDRLLSDVFLFPYGKETSRLVGITDGGVNPLPDVDQKARILVNAVRTFHALGCETPRVAVLSAVETPSELFPASLEAVELVELWRRGGFPDCVVDGPMALDLALSEEAAALKGVESDVAGRADILLFPGAEAANITAKAIEYTVPVEPAHVVVGGAAPILIPSRSESAEARLNAMALGCWMAGRA